VGNGGVLLERGNGTWKKLASPGATLTLVDVVAFGPTTVFVLSSEVGVHLHRFDGTAWSRPYNQTLQPQWAIDAVGPQELWSAGTGGTLVHWGP
jgi:hypothetical protein